MCAGKGFYGLCSASGGLQNRRFDGCLAWALGGRGGAPGDYRPTLWQVSKFDQFPCLQKRAFESFLGSGRISLLLGVQNDLLAGAIPGAETLIWRTFRLWEAVRLFWGPEGPPGRVPNMIDSIVI